MRRVFLALLADIALSAVLIFWGVRMLTGVETALPIIGDLPVTEGPTPPMIGAFMTAVSAASVAVAGWQMIPVVRQLWLSRVLADEGVCVQGVVTDLHRVRVIQVNQTTSVRLTIRCTAPSGRETEVKSAAIWAPEVQCGDAVDVIFDPMNEERYFIRLREKKFVRDSLRDKNKGRFL